MQSLSNLCSLKPGVGGCGGEKLLNSLKETRLAEMKDPSPPPPHNLTPSPNSRPGQGHSQCPSPHYGKCIVEIQGTPINGLPCLQDRPPVAP